MQFSVLKTKWGFVGFVVQHSRLLRVWLPQAEARIRRAVERDFSGAVESPQMLPEFQRQFQAYFADKRTGEQIDFSIEFDLAGQTDFRRRVLQRCAQIPYGEVRTYADLAREVGSPAAARAVGGAMAHNPIPLVIPCHRVVASNGTLGGFSSPGGLSLKERMLGMEREVMRTVMGDPSSSTDGTHPLADPADRQGIQTRQLCTA